MAEQEYYIAKCKELIETKLGWGNSEDWQTSDFERLGEKIFEETKLMLSSSTLKRIWGKVRYSSKPNLATLNALAQFAGYENWRSLTATHIENAEPNNKKSGRTIVNRWHKLVAVVATLAVVAVAVALVGNKKQPATLHFEKLQFTSKPVTKGLPNTVIFRYDATQSNADSVFIQQSWDREKRFPVDKNLHEYTSTYFYPGYYKAKLILNDSVVKEQDLYIETEGWVGIIEKNPVPVYIPKTVFAKQLMLTKEDLSALQIDFQKEAPIFSLTNVDKEININSDNFSLQAVVQNTYNESNSICQYTNVRIFGTNGVIDIPLCKIGCVGNVGLMLGMKYIDGRTHDLSGFGVDFSKEVKLNCETKQGVIRILVNDKLVYTGECKMGKIAGTQVKFNGTGIVRQFDLKEN